MKLEAQFKTYFVNHVYYCDCEQQFTLKKDDFNAFLIVRGDRRYKTTFYERNHIQHSVIQINDDEKIEKKQ